VPAAHQIHPHRVTRTHEVAQCLLLGPGHADRVQPAGQQQPDEMLGVATIGFHAIPARAGDLARRRDHTLDAALGELARQPVSRRPGLVRDPHRPRQPGAEAGSRVRIAAQRERL
jgi:hypothetical protein